MCGEAIGPGAEAPIWFSPDHAGEAVLMIAHAACAHAAAEAGDSAAVRTSRTS